MSGEISVVIYDPETLSVIIEDTNEISASMSIPEYVGATPYEGAYEVTPVMNNNIVLETEGKMMQDDVTVKKIPHYEIENESGGTTVYIAMEVE